VLLVSVMTLRAFATAYLTSKFDFGGVEVSGAPSWGASVMGSKRALRLQTVVAVAWRPRVCTTATTTTYPRACPVTQPDLSMDETSS
jgi:hypothetical protein